jgi:Leucine-rich repeat (LRR) protein
LAELSSLGQLTSLDVSHNQLLSIVSLSSLSKLKILDASFNQITILPNINSLTSLTSLDFSNNNIDHVTIVFNHPALINVSLGNNKITGVPDLSTLSNLQTLELSYNKLTNVPNLTKNALLKAVYLNNNNIDSLPPNLWVPNTVKNLRVEKNNVTFDDLLPLINILNYETVLTYAPQKTVFLQSNIKEKRGNTVIMSPSQDKNVTGLVLNWSKNGVTAGTTKNLLFSAVQFADSGLYKLTIGHAALPDLTYESDIISLKVTECVDTNHVSYATTGIQCLSKGKIEIQNASAEKYSYKLISKITNDTLWASNNVFSDLTFPQYEIIVAASNNCFVKKNQAINVPIEFCKEIVITPDGDGENDDYYFNQSGNINIYDKNNLLVTTLVGPCFWDAKSNYKPLPIGYYSAYLHNSKEKLGITIMY